MGGTTAAPLTAGAVEVNSAPRHELQAVDAVILLTRRLHRRTELSILRPFTEEKVLGSLGRPRTTVSWPANNKRCGRVRRRDCCRCCHCAEDETKARPRFQVGTAYPCQGIPPSPSLDGVVFRVPFRCRAPERDLEAPVVHLGYKWNRPRDMGVQRSRCQVALASAAAQLRASASLLTRSLHRSLHMGSVGVSWSGGRVVEPGCDRQVTESKIPVLSE